MNKYIQSLLGKNAKKFQEFLDHPDGGIVVIEAAQDAGKTLMAYSLGDGQVVYHVRGGDQEREIPHHVKIVIVDNDTPIPTYMYKRKLTKWRAGEDDKVIDNNFKWVIFTHDARPYKLVGLQVIKGRSTALTREEATRLVSDD